MVLIAWIERFWASIRAGACCVVLDPVKRANFDEIVSKLQWVEDAETLIIVVNL